jgi:hypothetical protein
MSTDPRVNDWPLMESPFPTMMIVAVYLYLVVALGPRLMANKKPYQLNAVLVAYNAVQVIFSVIMLWEVRVAVCSLQHSIVQFLPHRKHYAASATKPMRRVCVLSHYVTYAMDQASLSCGIVFLRSLFE